MLVISATDLMMDRLVQATDGTKATHDEALQLAIAAHERIAWNRIHIRARRIARSDPLLAGVVDIATELHAAGA